MTQASKSPSAGGNAGYFRASERPLQSLLFILPMLAGYEIGIRMLSGSPGGDPPGQVVAFALMQRFFVMLGATGAMLPALTVVGILLAWHIARKDAWSIRPLTAVGMGLESLLLCIPLLAMGFAAANHLPLMIPIDRETLNLLVLSFGAGVYEEAVFRLVGLTLLSMLLCDVLRMPSKVGLSLAVLGSAVLFALYHYWGSESFAWRSMVFRSLAGAYFGILFLYRGFGITAGAHATYDIVIVLMRQIVADAP